MARKLKVSPEKKKAEEKEIIEKANDNYSYYVLIRTIRAFLSDTVAYLRLKNQVDRYSKVLEIKNEMVDFKHKEWLDVINRFLNFIIKKYPNFKNDFDFKVMDSKKKKKENKIKLTQKATVNLYYKVYATTYADTRKSKYKEVTLTIDFFMYILGYIDVITECVNSENLKMDVNEKKTVKTILTKFNKYLRPDIMQILEGR